MSTRAAKKARATNRNAKRAEANAQKRGGGEIHTLPKPANDREKSGLEWLVHKRRITTRQALAGKHYGEDWRIAQTHGSVPLRSCLNDAPGGSGAARRMNHTAIVQKSTPRTDGGFLLRVRVEDNQRTDALVPSPTEEPEGKRITIEGAGALWRRV